MPRLEDAGVRSPVASSASGAPASSPGLGWVLSDWLNDHLVRLCGQDDDPWGVERVERAMTRLNAARAPAEPLQAVVLFEAEPTALIGPERYVYVTRGLLHLAWEEPTLAFVLAHELAHYDLGHTRVLGERYGWMIGMPGLLGVVLFAGLAGRWLNSPDHELAADARALDLCLAAGYDGPACVAAFDRLEAYALDHRAEDLVFGPPPPDEPPATLSDRLRDAAGDWIWRHLTGYPTLTERRDGLHAILTGPGGTGRPPGSGPGHRPG